MTPLGQKKQNNTKKTNLELDLLPQKLVKGFILRGVGRRRKIKKKQMHTHPSLEI